MLSAGILSFHLILIPDNIARARTLIPLLIPLYDLGNFNENFGGLNKIVKVIFDFLTTIVKRLFFYLWRLLYTTAFGVFIAAWYWFYLLI